MTYDVCNGGDKFWYKNKKFHRDDGPAIEWANGDRFWYKYGDRHRDDGPAIEYADGGNFWYNNDVLHRTDGPAIEYDEWQEWWIDNNELTPPEFADKVLDKETALLWKMSGYCWPFDFG